MRALETLAVHAGRIHPAPAGAIATPIYQTSTFGHSGDGDYDGVRYSRLSNGPNQLAVARKVAALCGQEAAVITASGMAAISTALLAFVKAGERVLFQRGVYGGTHMLATEDLPRLGIAADFAPDDDPAHWRDAVRPETRVIYVEAISNPLVKIIDLPAVVRLARETGTLAVIDATFASPVNLRPVDLGFDLELHSATKYLNGHSDLIAGAVCGSGERIREVVHKLNHLGGCLDPHACFLLERGLKTLPLRVRQQNKNALGLARFFAARGDVAAVHYPGLDPSRLPGGLAAHFTGFGGVLAVELVGGAERADRVLASLALATHAPSLGGPETLVTRPATTSHAGLVPAERRALGIGDGLIRIACGIEDTDDLAADFAQALDAQL
ncbi:MAG: aminotransferase class I/II-fold pyridoxal phosphate-dependent enzyme [Myxococcota bacterium]